MSTVHRYQQMRKQQASDLFLLKLINALLIENAFNFGNNGKRICQSKWHELIPDIDLKLGEKLLQLWLEPERRCLLFRVQILSAATIQNESTSSCFSEY